MIPLAERWTAGVRKDHQGAELAVARHAASDAARNISSAPRPRNGSEAHHACDFEMERFMHLYALNRGILLTPFHNMALMSPATAPEDVDYHSKVFREAIRELAG